MTLLGLQVHPKGARSRPEAFFDRLWEHAFFRVLPFLMSSGTAETESALFPMEYFT